MLWVFFWVCSTNQKCLFKHCSESLGWRKSYQRKFLPKFLMKWTKYYFLKGQKFISSNQKLKKGITSCQKVWKVTLNTYCPARELRKFWYPEYTPIWTEVARRLNRWGKYSVSALLQIPLGSAGPTGQPRSEVAAEWEGPRGARGGGNAWLTLGGLTLGRTWAGAQKKEFSAESLPGPQAAPEKLFSFPLSSLRLQKSK